MGAPAGNQFWKLRSKHGRNKIFETSEMLWATAVEYFEWCDNHPYLRPEQKKGNISIPRNNELTDEQVDKISNSIVNIETLRPYSIEGLCMYIGVNVQYLNDFENGIKDKDVSLLSEDESLINKDFSAVITRIKYVIRERQIDGGLIGGYNPMLVARILNLRERTDITSEDKALNITNVTFAGLSSDEVDSLSNNE